MMRYLKLSLLDVMSKDYIRTARAKGLAERDIIVKHALRNAIIPFLTVGSGLFPLLVGGSVVVEFIFNIPGMGTYLLEAVHNRDYNAIMAVQILVVGVTLLSILGNDITYALVDPRIKQ